MYAMIYLQQEKKLNDLKELESQFCNLAIQGVVCNLSEHYSNLTIAVLEELIGHELTAKMHGKDGNKYKVSLPDCKTNEDATRLLDK